MKEPEKLSFTDVPTSPHYTITASLLMPPPLPTNNRPFAHPHCLLPPTRPSIRKSILKPSLFPHHNPSSSTMGYYYINTDCPLLPMRLLLHIQTSMSMSRSIPLPIFFNIQASYNLISTRFCKQKRQDCILSLSCN